ncbi:MAG: hypothetical protein Q8P51_10130 [Ignavibacteria bacterium]|nr:hypothetical protein [Ignavibacteria bacterium]
MKIAPRKEHQITIRDLDEPEHAERILIDVAPAPRSAESRSQLTKLDVDGSGGVVKELENERVGLSEELSTIKAEVDNQISVVDTAREVQEFMSNFDSIFELASMA